MAKIHKLSKNGQTIYPATTTDAVAHPTLKVSVSKLIGEINVSNLYPTGGTDGTNKYTLASAIAKIPTDLRTVGIKCSFYPDGFPADFSPINAALFPLKIREVYLRVRHKLLTSESCLHLLPTSPVSASPFRRAGVFPALMGGPV